MNTIASAAAILWHEISQPESATSQCLERYLGRLPVGAVIGAYSLPLIMTCVAHGTSPGRLPEGGQKHYELALAARALEEGTPGEPRPPRAYNGVGALIVGR